MGWADPVKTDPIEAERGIACGALAAGCLARVLPCLRDFRDGKVLSTVREIPSRSIRSDDVSPVDRHGPLPVLAIDASGSNRGSVLETECVAWVIELVTKGVLQGSRPLPHVFHRTSLEVR
jgi:hypothetical protein